MYTGGDFYNTSRDAATQLTPEQRRKDEKTGTFLSTPQGSPFKQLSAEGLPQVNVTPGERGAGAPQKVSSLPWPFAASATTLNLLMELHGIPTAVSPHGGWAAAAVRPDPGPHLMLCPLSALRLDTTTPHPLWTGAAAAALCPASQIPSHSFDPAPLGGAPAAAALCRPTLYRGAQYLKQGLAPKCTINDDSIDSTNDAEKENFPIKFLNSITPLGMLCHKLKLKVMELHRKHLLVLILLIYQRPDARRFVQEWVFLPLAAGTAFALAGAAFPPSHTAQRPGAAGVVRNACIVAMHSHLLLAPALLTPTAGAQCLSRLLGTISGCEQRLPALITPEGFSTSPCS
ncbi:hypothetical protein QTO34_001466 [Cnephaeus nilssonii]|uniref:Uncharacterized protein n=1 Tax=Cnephaeus nilssonii TaxID=3371016 RepID=A0AA40HW19_CNENI|nr:hypothetical protein QTO34_001466 [Eptesicus nilssonii]